ncbi:UNVERIFIED_CONTAM: acetylglutamate kinase, partial [Bacillus mycoides]
MKNLYIIKIGGDTLNSEISLQNCIKACSKSGKNIILVHGGGKKVTELASKLDIPQQMIEGRRITSPETLD